MTHVGLSLVLAVAECLVRLSSAQKSRVEILTPEEVLHSRTGITRSLKMSPPVVKADE